MSFLIIWLALTVGLTMWHFAKIKAAGKPENRARLWEKRKHKYIFNENSGEWNYITGTTHEGVTYSTQSRGERLAHESQFKRHQRYAVPMIYGFGAIPLTAFIEIIPNMFDTTHFSGGTVAVEWGAILLILSLVVIGCGWVVLWGECRGGPYFGESGTVIDPPARPLRGDDFGPSAGGLPDTGPAVPDYQPNR